MRPRGNPCSAPSRTPAALGRHRFPRPSPRPRLARTRAPRRRGALVGDAVALPGDRVDCGARPVWFAGSTLAYDLSLPRVRERFTPHIAPPTGRSSGTGSARLPAGAQVAVLGLIRRRRVRPEQRDDPAEVLSGLGPQGHRPLSAPLEDDVAVGSSTVRTRAGVPTPCSGWWGRNARAVSNPGPFSTPMACACPVGPKERSARCGSRKRNREVRLRRMSVAACSRPFTLLAMRRRCTIEPPDWGSW